MCLTWGRSCGMLAGIAMLEFIDKTLDSACGFLWGYILIFALLGTHLYLTCLLRFPQRHFFTGLKLYFAKHGEGQISQFSSLMVSLAANVGTGNIVGVAVAVTTGGPGAVFWCMLTGVFGMATRYAESLLAIRYRTRDEKGNIIGGPMYAIEKGLKCKWLAVVFAVVTAIAAFGIGNLTQANAVSQVLANSALAVPTWVTGVIMVLLVGAVLLGGLQGIARVCTALVPTMAIVYIVGCAAILISNADFVWPAICHIVDSAFHPQAAAGGFVGSTLMLAMQQGVRRGLFSNEAGLGSSPIVSAPSQTPNTVQHALVASTGPFWDTVVICTLTGITLTTCIMAHDHITTNDGELLTYVSFASLGTVGSTMLTISLAAFVISTVLGWSYFGERSLEYIGGRRLIYPYRVLWIIVAFIGCVVPKSSIVWNFADLANGLMALPNLICMVGLSGVLVAETRKYLWEKRLFEVDETLLTENKVENSEKN